MSKSLFASLAEAPSDPPGLRRTALFLHGLHPADRDHLLAGISADQRHGLAALLQELDQLGIQATEAAQGVAALSLVASGTVEAVGAGARPGEELDADWLGRADARAVSEVLAAEPDLLVARVLRLNAWPWKSRVLDLLEGDRRARVNELLLDPAGRHREHGRLDAALLRQLRRAVEQRRDVSSTLEAPGAHVPAESWTARVMGRLSRRRTRGRPM